MAQMYAAICKACRHEFDFQSDSLMPCTRNVCGGDDDGSMKFDISSAGRRGSIAERVGLRATKLPIINFAIRMQRMVWLTFAGAFFLLGHARGDVRIESDTKWGALNPTLHIYNKIAPKDFEKINAFFSGRRDLNQGTGVSKFVFLDSPGGDVETALKISNLLRSHFYTATIRSNAKCLSACAILFATSANRTAHFGALLGVHRPYTLMGVDQGSANVSKFEKAGRKIREALQNVGVAPELWDMMVKTPPEETHILSGPEIIKFNLLGSSVAYQDIMDSQEAANLKIPRRELYRRKDLAKVCRTRSGYIEWSPSDSLDDQVRRADIYDACQKEAGLNPL